MQAILSHGCHRARSDFAPSQQARQAPACRLQQRINSMKLWHKLRAPVVSPAPAAVVPRRAAGAERHQDRRLEHRVPDRRSGRRRVPDPEARQGARDRRHRPAPAAASRSSAAARPTSPSLAPDPEGRDGSLPQGRHQVHRAAGRVRRADRRRQPAEHLGQDADRRRPEEDVGAGRAGPRSPTGTRSAPMAGRSR